MSSRCGQFAIVSVLIGFLALAVAERHSQKQEILLAESASSEKVLGVVGGEARLSCPVGGVATAVIWYKEGHDSPVYTWDSRGRSPDRAQHWSAPMFSGRAHFKLPPALQLSPLRSEDSGAYRCRIDFQKSPTKNTRVNLTVIVPPKMVEILDEVRSPLKDYTRPCKEGDEVHLTCVAHGGDPPAAVSWWLGGALISHQPVLKVIAERSKLGHVYTCQGSNNNITAPLSATVRMDMKLKPLWVRIQGGARSFSANRSTEVICQTVGARPKASVSWWRGSSRLKSTRESVSVDGNVTTSILSFTPSVEDSGKYLSCRAVQPSLPDSGIEDGWKLDIHHVPLVSLELGSSLNAADITEGSDVYFECNIKSNPWFYKIQWLHGSDILQSNPAEGVIISNQSLVLQRLKRTRSGVYLCQATNEEGTGRSNKLLLNVKYRPYCKKSQQYVYNSARNEETKVICELHANPKDSVHFTWKFNNSEMVSIPLPVENIIVSNTGNYVSRNEGLSVATSIASYTPRNSSDYGTITCSGGNSVGEQITPCVFHIVPAGKPDQVSNCSVTNQTSDSLNISCVEGFDGGLPQRYLVQVFNMHTNFLLKNATFDSTSFEFSNLQSGSAFIIEVSSYNKKGASEPYVLHAYTNKLPLQQTSGVAMALELTPLLTVLMTLTGFLVLLAIALVMLARCRGPRRMPQNSPSTTKPYGEHPDGSSIPLNATDTESVDSLDKSPDILLDGKLSSSSLNRSRRLTDSSSGRASLRQYKETDVSKLSADDSQAHNQTTRLLAEENGQYVQVRYLGRPPVYRMSGPLTGLPQRLGVREDQSNSAHVYDKVYEDMLQHSGHPTRLTEDPSLSHPELYMSCHPSQALYSTAQNGGRPLQDKMASAHTDMMAAGEQLTHPQWLPPRQYHPPHLANFVCGQTTTSRTSSPIANPLDMDYLIMSPGHKAQVLPKISYHQRVNPYQEAAYTSMPLMNHVLSPVTSVPSSLGLTYERISSPEEVYRSLHIRLEPPGSEGGSANTSTTKTIESPTALREMTTDFSWRGSASEPQNQCAETNH